jgi:hypothetical protein
LSFDGADFGLVGGAYEAPLFLQDAQRLINWYVEIDPDSRAKEPVALLGCPGLNPIIATQSGQVRGAWVLPGNQQCLFVTGNTLYLATVTVPATSSSIPQFSVAAVGTLFTNSGPVCIRDNGPSFGGAGGYAVIVDGTYGYYYRLSGTVGTITFTGSTTVGSNLITPSGAVNQYIVAGSAISDTAGAVPGPSTVVQTNFNASNIQISFNATANVPSDTFTVTTPVFGQIVDPGFLPADRVAFIEGWLIFNYTGTRTFFTSGPVAYTLAFPASFYSLKDSSSDNLVTLFENSRELWLIGERTSEVWFNQGGANFAFSRLPGIGPQIGCSAKHSITRVGSNIAWLGQNEQGQNIVVMNDEYSWQKVSTHAIDHAIASYPVVSDAIGYSYEEDGHIFYMLIFPTADVTWCLDYTVWTQTEGKLGWHQRLFFDTTFGLYHRHRSNCFANFADVRMVGDYQTGQIHQLSRSVYTDAGYVLRCQRRTPHVWSREDRKRVFQSAIQVEFAPGVGLQTGQGVNPQAMLRWSNDGGKNWGNEHWTTIGAAGATLNRAIWRRLGRARDRIYELNFSDPVQRDIIGATLFGEPEAKEPEAA